MTSPAVALNDLKAPLGALRLLTVDFPGLPAGNIALSELSPDLLELTFHDDLSAFEMWRVALDIATEAVTCHEQSSGRTRVLQAWCDFAGAHIRLTGFADVPEPIGGAA